MGLRPWLHNPIMGYSTLVPRVFRFTHWFSFNVILCASDAFPVFSKVFNQELRQSSWSLGDFMLRHSTNGCHFVFARERNPLLVRYIYLVLGFLAREFHVRSSYILLLTLSSGVLYLFLVSRWMRSWSSSFSCASSCEVSLVGYSSFVPEVLRYIWCGTCSSDSF